MPGVIHIYITSARDNYKWSKYEKVIQLLAQCLNSMQFNKIIFRIFAL